MKGNIMLKKMLRKSVLISAAMVIMLSVFVGETFAKNLKFALIVHVTGTPFWKPVKKGIEDAGKQLGVDVQFMGPEAFSIQKQVDTLDSAIAQGFDGIGVALADPTAMDRSIARARKKGIPVISFNVDDQNTPNERMAFVGQSFIVAGNVLAEAVLKGEKVDTNADALVLIGEPGNSALEERAEGIEQVLDKYGIKHSRFVAPLANPTEGIDMLKAKLRANKNIKYVLGTAFGGYYASKAMIELGMEPGSVLIGAFDLEPNVNEMIQKGYLKITIDQQPYLQGYQTVHMLYMNIMYGITPTSINTGVAVIDKSNIDVAIKNVAAGYR